MKNKQNAETHLYQENEIEYLMTKSNCFFLAQSYQENQAKIAELKIEIKKHDFQLQKLSSVSVSKAKNLFIENSRWIPITNSNFLIYSREPISENKVDAVLKNLVPLMRKSQVLPLFFKKDLLVCDTSRLGFYNQSTVSLHNKSYSLALFLQNQIRLPVLPSWTALARNFLFLLDKNTSKKQKNPSTD